MFVQWTGIVSQERAHLVLRICNNQNRQITIDRAAFSAAVCCKSGIPLPTTTCRAAGLSRRSKQLSPEHQSIRECSAQCELRVLLESVRRTALAGYPRDMRGVRMRRAER